MNVRFAYLVAALPVAIMACGAERLQGAAPKLDLSIEQAKENAGDVVDFGDVVQPNSATRRITIANSGASQLHIMNVKQTGDKVFKISTPPGDVESGKSGAFNATFTPTDIRAFSGAIDFDTEHTARVHHPAVQHHTAGPTVAVVAAFLCPGHPEFVAKDLEQALSRLAEEFRFIAVQARLYMGSRHI